MRLIDADKLKINLYHNKKVVLNDDLVKCIDDTETAYSVDKVVEEFGKASWEETDISTVIYIDDAIEIVKQGCVSDDVCEWIMQYKTYDWQPSCETNSVYNVSGVGWFKYCPYCGKKIKIVGD